MENDFFQSWQNKIRLNRSKAFEDLLSEYVKTPGQVIGLLVHLERWDPEFASRFSMARKQLDEQMDKELMGKVSYLNAFWTGFNILFYSTLSLGGFFFVVFYYSIHYFLPNLSETQNLIFRMAVNIYVSGYLANRIMTMTPIWKFVQRTYWNTVHSNPNDPLNG
jgi:hypothetical protein